MVSIFEFQRYFFAALLRNMGPGVDLEGFSNHFKFQEYFLAVSPSYIGSRVDLEGFEAIYRYY